MSKQITKTVYKFSELSEDVQQKLFSDYEPLTEYIYSEAGDTIKAFLKLENVTTSRNSWLDYISHGYENADKLRGVRLRTWLINNFTWLDSPKYLKSFGRKIVSNAFKCEVKANYKKDGFYTILYSKLNKTTDCCLSGVCYDYSFLSPVYLFIKNPNNSDTLDDILRDCFNSLRLDIENEVSHISSFEYFKEDQENLGNYFDENGQLESIG